MAEIGTLEFTISTKDETSPTIDAIARKIQEMSEGINEAGSITDEQMARIAQDIQDAYAGLDQASATHRASLDSLQQTYDQLGVAMGEAFREGTQKGDMAYRMANQQRNAVAAQIREEKKLGKQIDDTAKELQDVEDAYNKKAKAVKSTTSAEASMRRQMMLIVQEMAQQEEAARAAGGETAVQALRASKGFQDLQAEAGRLSNAMGDAKKQMSVFANDNAGLQGVIVGLQGMSGAMSAAQGIVGMFTTDQEKLQQVMLKVQSVMAIANGMMAVSNALNKDSYFTLVILNRIKQAWASTSAEALAAQKAETAGTIKDTAAKGANSVATGVNTAAENAGTAARAKGLKGWIASRMAAANDTKAKIANAIAAKALTVSNGALAFSFRAVAVAIKSIPVVGWVLAGVGALVGILTALFNTSSEAEEQQEKLNEKIVESAAEPVASLSKLSAQYSLLGDNMQAKQKFIEDNKEEFDKLGISIASVSDAEEVLIQNKEKFVQAQIAKAAASAAYEELKEKAKELVEAEQELAEKDSDKRREAVQEAEDAMDELIGYAESKMAEADTLMGRFAANTQATSNKVAQKTGEGAAESIASLHRLADQWKSLGGNIQKQNKFIAENKGEFDKLGLGIRNATDAENVLVKNKDKFVEAMTAKAESMAYFGLATDKFKEYIEAQMTIDNLAGKLVRGEATADEEAAFRNASQRVQQAKREAENLIKKGNEAEANASALNTGGTNTKDDPFITNLNEKKKAYERYAKFVRSTDETLQAAAKGDEFKQLLEGGASYREYLENQIAEMEAAGGKTQAYRDHLKALYDELASIEKNTVIDDFRKALEQQLAAAQTQQEMLDIIAQNRKKLEDGGDVEVNKEKGDILDQQQKAIEDKEKERTNALLQQYSDYLTKKIQFEADYAENSRRLNQAITEAKTEDERKAYEQALAALNRQRERYAKSTATGDADYDALITEFASYQQQKENLEKKYQDKINIAIQHNNTQLADDLRAKMKEEIGKLAADELKNSDVFKQLFDGDADFDKMATGQLQSLIDNINEQLKLHPELDPATTKEITDKLQKAIEEVANRNPFAKLKQQWQEFVDGIKKGDISGTMETLGGTLGDIGSIIGSVGDGLSELGIINEQSQDTLENVQGMVSGAADIAVGIASGNYLQAIQGGIQLAVNACKEFSPAYREMKEYAQQHEAAVAKLQEAYKELSKEVQNSTGQMLTQAQQNLLDNLNQQIEEAKKAIEFYQNKVNEGGSGKADAEEELKANIDTLDELIEQRDNLLRDITNAALGDKSINSAMEDLATALVDAWAAGENAVDAYHNKVKDMVRDIARNMIIQQLITEKLKSYFDNTFTDDFVKLDNEEKEARIRQLMNDVDAYGEQMMEMMDGFSDEMKEWLSMDTEASGLSGAIKGMSQESADLLAGVANAMRLNQAAIINSLSEILIQTTGIRTNTATANSRLNDIYREIQASASSVNRAERILGSPNTNTYAQ